MFSRSRAHGNSTRNRGREAEERKDAEHEPQRHAKLEARYEKRVGRNIYINMMN